MDWFPVQPVLGLFEGRSQDMKAIVRYFGVASLVALLAYLEGCAGLYGGGKRQTNAELTLVSFGSVNGELVPCG